MLKGTNSLLYKRSVTLDLDNIEMQNIIAGFNYTKKSKIASLINMRGLCISTLSIHPGVKSMLLKYHGLRRILASHRAKEQSIA